MDYQSRADAERRRADFELIEAADLRAICQYEVAPAVELEPL